MFQCSIIWKSCYLFLRHLELEFDTSNSNEQELEMHLIWRRVGPEQFGYFVVGGGREG